MNILSFARMLRREQRVRARQSRRRPPPLRVAVVGDQRTIQRWLLKNAMKSSPSRNWYLPDGRMIVYSNDEVNFWGHRIEEVVVLYGANTAAIVSAHARKVT